MRLTVVPKPPMMIWKARERTSVSVSSSPELSPLTSSRTRASADSRSSPESARLAAINSVR